MPEIIIIYEPDPMIRGVLRVEFSHWDFAVLLAESADEAEAYATQAVASMVVLDAERSHLAAFQACARIRRIPGYSHRPIVVTMKQMSDRTKAAGEAAKATVLLTKPYSMMDLFQAVRPHLPANDPLLTTSPHKLGVAAPPQQEWKPGSAPQWHSNDVSALSRNKMLLPIVRGTGKRIPVYRIS